MKHKTKSVTRRDFLKETTSAAALASMGFPLFQTIGKAETKKTKVVLVRDKNVVKEINISDPVIIQEMLDAAVMELTGASSVQKAWKQLIKPTDIVGVKSNVWGPLPTPPEIESAIKKRVMEAGVDKKNIDVDDRNVLKKKIFTNATALINVRPLRTHHWSGIGGVIKNYIMFVPEPWQYHDNLCENLGALWNLPLVKNKTRLNILVVLTPLFHGVGAHHFDLKYTWKYCGILVSKDPVAIDMVGLQLLKAKRKEFFEGQREPQLPVTFIHAADKKHKIGTSDINNIDLVKLGWKEHILI